MSTSPILRIYATDLIGSEGLTLADTLRHMSWDIYANVVFRKVLEIQMGRTRAEMAFKGKPVSG